MTLLATVTSKGQMTIPKQFRDALGIKPRQKFIVEQKGDALLMRRAGASIHELVGSVKSPVSFTSRKDEIEAAAAGLASRYERKRK